jgi:hypothetical protein
MAVTNYPEFFGVPALSRDQFNALASQSGLPFVVVDKLADPAQLKIQDLEFIDPTQRDFFVKDGQFTSQFENAYKGLAELQRRQTVGLSLAEGRTITIEADLSGISRAEKIMVEHLVNAAMRIDVLYMKQTGAWRYSSEVQTSDKTDFSSKTFFKRNMGPWATAGRFASDPFANALPTFPKKHLGVYPSDVEVDESFLEKLRADPQGLGHQWTVVEKTSNGELKPVFYHESDLFHQDMQAVARELDKAAEAIKYLKNEIYLYAYLRDAAAAFRNGDWDTADKSWAAMNMHNSKWALRVAPDETYWDLANTKAGFQFWFAKIDTKGAKLADGLAPFLQNMEDEISRLYPLYEARKVNFEMPNTIEMIYRAGNHRSAMGATIGEKLPNFSNDVSRMVVMTNYYGDSVSRQTAIEKAGIIFTDDIAKTYAPDRDVSTFDTLLHEATHGFGVNADVYYIKDPATGQEKKDSSGNFILSKTALGGANSQVIEELKAQTGSLYYTGWQLEKGIIDQQTANKLYLDAILWAFGHISRGMGTAEEPRAYSQLAAIQVRALLNGGAMTIEDGKFRLHYEKFHAVATELLTEVTRIQVTGDREAIQKIRDDIMPGAATTGARR